MIKVTFKEPTECIYRGRIYRHVVANFILCKSVSKINCDHLNSYPNVKDDHLYIPNSKEWIKSIEQVKPSDL